MQLLCIRNKKINYYTPAMTMAGALSDTMVICMVRMYVTPTPESNSFGQSFMKLGHTV